MGIFLLNEFCCILNHLFSSISIDSFLLSDDLILSSSLALLVSQTNVSYSFWWHFLSIDYTNRVLRNNLQVTVKNAKFHPPATLIARYYSRKHAKKISLIENVANIWAILTHIGSFHISPLSWMKNEKKISLSTDIIIIMIWKYMYHMKCFWEK